ncbi:YdcF family protein [Lamprobacter modestohalophilus]|uniref:YdcF family protein n=1 Tax=Lamprobacter modestohalophilus TaxID=1064514 RepID=UPI002ADEBE61|nr:YdcF family protein [Lamprobacter modestohalophilus]MEA1048215.1 YdcF family protein [Lamprobacter modestohalophilus]
MDIIKGIVVTLCSPLVIACLFFVVGLLFGLAHRVLARKISYGIAAGVLLIFSQPYFTDLLLYPLEHLNRVEPDLENAKSLIYPLACYYSDKGDVPEISRWAECSLQRLTAAARLYHQYQGKVLVTGGKSKSHENVSYAEKATALLVSLGVRKQDILLMKRGGTTAGEITAAMAFLKDRPTLIISSATHIRRIRLLVDNRKHISFYPVDFISLGNLAPRLEIPSIFALEATRRAFYEYIALAKDYYLRRKHAAPEKDPEKESVVSQ